MYDSVEETNHRCENCKLWYSYVRDTAEVFDISSYECVSERPTFGAVDGNLEEFKVARISWQTKLGYETIAIGYNVLKSLWPRREGRGVARSWRKFRNDMTRWSQ